ncbi:hypothetical protein NB693_21370 [Pantoea ananatis]|nr:hypothetical protein [Pantoea ananatis]
MRAPVAASSLDAHKVRRPVELGVTSLGEVEVRSDLFGDAPQVTVH